MLYTNSDFDNNLLLYMGTQYESIYINIQYNYCNEQAPAKEAALRHLSGQILTF